MNSYRRAIEVTCMLVLFTIHVSAKSIGSAASSKACGDRQIAAQWLSAQLRHNVGASQILASTLPDPPDRCRITRVRAASTGATSISVRCPNYMPNIVLLAVNVKALSLSAQSSDMPTPTQRIVHTGSSLRADWHTDSMHAQLDVVALDAGAAGSEIRVRIAHTNRVLRARIVDAHTAVVVKATA